MTEQIVIDRRFRGPPESGHGGYVCGVVAGLIGTSAEITLRRPPPLDAPLEAQAMADGRVALRAGGALVAEGFPTESEAEVPEPVSFRQAEEASKSFAGFDVHPFPMCFGCGPQRAEGDGLRIFPGPIQGRDIVAAPWIPDASLADHRGTVRSEFIWAALDCPGGWALLMHQYGEGPPVLGRLAASLVVPIQRDDRCVIIAWPLGGEGRKLLCGSALFTHSKGLHAVARATWILPA